MSQPLTDEQQTFTTLGGPYTFSVIPGVSTYNFTVIGGGGGGGGNGGLLIFSSKR